MPWSIDKWIRLEACTAPNQQGKTSIVGGYVWSIDQAVLYQGVREI